MTSGDYADTPLAVWIWEQLNEREWSKSKLAVELAGVQGLSKETALRKIIRWTKHGGDADADSRDALSKIFGKTPPGEETLGPALSRLADDSAATRAMVEHLQQMVGQLLAGLGGQARAGTGQPVAPQGARRPRSAGRSRSDPPASPA